MEKKKPTNITKKPAFVLIDIKSLFYFTRIELSVDNEPVNCVPSIINQCELKWKWFGLPLARWFL